jgi:hypothetical protein
MKNVTKRVGILGGTAALVSGLAIGGLALPANAATGDSADTTQSTTQSTTRTSSTSTVLDGITLGRFAHFVRDANVGNGSLIDGPVVQGPLTGDIASGNTAGDVASGNPVASGNDVSGNPVASGNGNNSPVASGNQANGNSAADGSANGNSATAPVGSGNDTSLSDIGSQISSSVKSTVDDALKGTSDLGAALGR